MLSTSGLAGRRGYTTLFSDVALAVRAGEALCVTGPNGVGKTTLLRMLAGLTAPVAGEIRWRDRVVQPFDRALREAVAFNGHLAALKDELSAEENLALWMALDDRTVANDAIVAALDTVALQRHARLPVRFLSQGQRRRVGLARLRLVERPVWILDEPLTALDVDAVEQLGALLARHLDAGGLCVAASHQPLPLPSRRLHALELASSAP
jgi:heme exporter protein A